MKSISFFLLLLLYAARPVNAQISIKVFPEPVFIENDRNTQILNFDFLIANSAADTLQLTKVTVSVYDSASQLLHQRFLDSNGTSPSINLLPKRTWNGIEEHLVFNPFTDFRLATAISRLDYDWVFENQKEEEIKIRTTVLPIEYVQKVAMEMPLKGRVLVYDAHDYYSHHRRFDYNFGPIKALGINTNFMRYAYDFVSVDSKNQQFSGKGEDREYIGFGKEVDAVADGKVIYAVGDRNDDKKFDVSKLKDNPLELYGNCVAIEHSDKSVSVYGHLKANSVRLKKGDMVKSGQQIGQVGTSGSSFFPHLHFEVRTSITASAQGLPSYFSNVTIVEGTSKTSLNGISPQTGSIIE
ncbi:MAG TPA: M23 family metallopeptidase [Flavobacterium sp.]|jgi:hypothetical protein